MPRISFIIAVLTLISFSATSVVAKQPCIGVITAGAGENFWTSLSQGAIAAGEDFGYQVISRGPKLEANYIAQKEIIKYFEERECVGLVLAPNTQSLEDDVIRLQKKGVVVVFADRPLKGIPNVPLYTTDNFEAGKLAAEKLLANLSPEQTNIAVFRLDENVETTRLREEGFIETVLQHGKKIISDAHVGTYVPDIIDNTLAQLRRLNVPVHGVFSPNEDSTVAVISALNYMKQHPVHVGFDLNAFIEKAIKEGHLLGTIVQQPHAMGYAGVEAIHFNLKTAIEPKSKFLKVDFVTSESFN